MIFYIKKMKKVFNKKKEIFKKLVGNTGKKKKLQIVLI